MVTVVIAIAAMIANATILITVLFIIFGTSTYINVMFNLFLPSMRPFRLML